MDLKIYNIDDLDQNRDQFQLKFLPAQPGIADKCQVSWLPIPPPESTDGPFKVETSQCVIPSKTVSTFKVVYYLNEARKCNSVITATPKLVKNSHEDQIDFDLGSLAVKLNAETFLPKLDLHKLPDINGDIVYKFFKWSADKSPKQARTILLINRLASHMYFDLSLSGPFSFLSATKS